MLFLGILASAFTGIDESGIHAECADRVDNDGNAPEIFIYGHPGTISSLSGIDAQDQNCLFYPYADGNGESDTPSSQQYQRSGEYPSLFEYHRDNGGQIPVCHGLRFSGEPVSGDPVMPTSNPLYTGEEVAMASTYIIQLTGFPHTSFFGCPP